MGRTKSTNKVKDSSLSIINSIKLDNQTTEIANNILNEADLDKVKDLTALFNLNQRKKNVIRLMKFNGLLDTISDSMIERFQKCPGEFNNQDLLNYLSVIQSAIDRTQKSLDMVNETPPIQINQQTNVQINESDIFDRESKERIADAIKAIISKAKELNVVEDKGDNKDETNRT